MLLLFCLIAVVSAESYSRGFLRDMRRQDEERRCNEIINEGVQQIENSVLHKAQAGYTYLTIPYPGCVELIRNDQRISVEKCEYIVKHIKDKITVKFPDSDLSYDEQTKHYTLDWS
jgi:hypothetical protein